MQLISQGVLGPAMGGHDGAPLAAVAERLFGAGGRGLVLACTMLATLGVLAGDLLATPRSFIPVAEDGMLPSSLASVHSRYHTPHVAIITYAAVSCALAVSGTFKPLAILASVSLLLIYLAVCLAALRVRYSGPAPAGAFRAPGGPLVPSCRRRHGGMAARALDARRGGGPGADGWRGGGVFPRAPPGAARPANGRPRVLSPST